MAGEATAGEPAGMASSVEAPMWRALAGYRALTAGYAVFLFGLNYQEYVRPLVGIGYLALLLTWTALTMRSVSNAERCTPRFLAVDLTIAVSGVLLSRLTDPGDTVSPTLPSVWVAGSVLAVALKAGWRWAAGAAALVGVANLVQEGHFSRSTLHNVLLVCVASIAVGYVIELARASERTLARALRIEAATRERERLARDIHDSVLQVLAMVQRRGAAIGGETAELGRLAGEQERALRALVAGGPPPDGAAARPPRPAAASPPEAGAADTDLAALLALSVRRPPEDGPPGRVSYARPPGPVPLPGDAARELAAAVEAALDNVRRHTARPPAGEPADAWVLLEDEPDAVMVTVRDDGPGIPPGRLAEAEAEGRLGARLSIRGRLESLGGTAEWTSPPGQGTEVELRLPRRWEQRGEGSRE